MTVSKNCTSERLTARRTERSAVVLAAGKGTRFRSKIPKVLHPLCGRPMIVYLLDVLKQLSIDEPIIVVGEGAELVRSALAGYGVHFVLQREQLGTGHAVQCAVPLLETRAGNVLVLSGDTPFAPREALEQLFSECDQGAAEALLTVELEDPSGNGRILRNTEGDVVDIIEEKDADGYQKQIREVNAGFACFRVQDLLEYLPSLRNDNAAGEFYLTDMVRILHQAGKRVRAVRLEKSDDVVTINDRVQLAAAERRVRRRIATHWMLRGVTMTSPESCLIEPSVSIGADSVLEDGVILRGKTSIGEGSCIGAYTTVRDSQIGDKVSIGSHCVVSSSTIGSGTTIESAVTVEAGSAIGSNCTLGTRTRIRGGKLDDGTVLDCTAAREDAEGTLKKRKAR